MAHLRPIFDRLKHIDTFHFLSDSPSTQYRNKKIFYFLAGHMKYFIPRISALTWNFSEAGHGKGALDGIGAVLKRTADRLVAEGNDIPNLASLFSQLSQSVKGITLITVSKENIESVDKLLEKKYIKAFCGTLKVHQVTWHAQMHSNLYFRKLSCFKCHPETLCKHHHLGQLHKDLEQGK